MMLESEDGELQTDHDDDKWAASTTKSFEAKWKSKDSDQVHRLREARRIYDQGDFRMNIDKLAEVTHRIKNIYRCDDEKVCSAAWLGLDPRHLVSILEDWDNIEASKGDGDEKEYHLGRVPSRGTRRPCR